MSRSERYIRPSDEALERQLRSIEAVKHFDSEREELLRATLKRMKEDSADEGEERSYPRLRFGFGRRSSLTLRVWKKVLAYASGLEEGPRLRFGFGRRSSLTLRVWTKQVVAKSQAHE
jgi:hypothetical protein